MDDGHVVVDSIEPIRIGDITRYLALESGFDNVKDLLEIARHGSGRQAYLIRFHYLQPGAWELPSPEESKGGRRSATLLERIRRNSRPARGKARS
jgi:hypothetical protein